MSSNINSNSNSLQRNTTLTSSKAYSDAKGNDEKKKITFEAATHKYQQKSFKECLKLVKENPDNDPLFFRDDSLFSSFGPKVSHGAQKFLALAYCKENKGAFHFAEFKKSIENLGFHDIAKELKESYFNNVHMLKYTNKDVVKLDEFTRPYFASHDVFVKPAHIPTQVVENKEILRKITSFCDKKEILSLAATCGQAQRLIFTSQESFYTHTVSGLKETLVVETTCVMSLVVLPDGRLASGSYNGDIKIWNLATAQCEATLWGHTHYVRSLFINRSGRLVSESYDGTIKTWNLSTLQCEQTRTYKSADRIRIQHPNGCRVTSGSGIEIKIWDRDIWRCEAVLKGHTGYVESLSILPNGCLVSGSADGEIKIWNLETRQCEATMGGHTSHVFSLLVLPDGRLASGSGDGTIKFWNLATQQCEGTLRTSNTVWELVLLPNGRFASGGDGTIDIWETLKIMPRRK